jgi:hypothetical protein
MYNYTCSPGEYFEETMNRLLPLPLRSRAEVWALVGAFVIASAVGPVWAQNGQQDMPGMDISKDKPKPTPTPQKKKKTAKPKQDDMGNMPGMATATPAPTPSPSTSPTPTPSRQQMENMPGMQMPAASPTPSPQASPSPGEMEPNMQMPAKQAPVTDSLKTNTGQNKTGAMENMPGMNPADTGPVVMLGDDMSIQLGVSKVNVMPMGQMASGTSWEPSSSPMYMLFKLSKVGSKWAFMFHFNLITGINSQGGPLGHMKFESQNWFMPMAFHKLGKGMLQLRGMFSAEPFTFPPGGSGLLFQTGESYKGQPIRNAQHPHDLFMELSAAYTLPIGERATWFAYFGYPGEPALGPPAFMHRWSASEIPGATLAHHQEDSTHISFGVLTSGLTYRKFKLEGSIFNGQEPDENRYNFEAHPWQSRSARLSFAPNRNWTTQVSYGFLKKPEALQPTTDMRRATASISYNRPFLRGWWATSLIWGRNHLSSPGNTANQNAYTAESTVNFLDKNYLYTRLELVDRDELLNDQQLAQLGFKVQPSFRIGAYTFGGDRDIWDTDKLSMAVGSDVTFYSKPAVLDTLYGQHPVSCRLFFRIRPSKMKMDMGKPGTVRANSDNMGGQMKPMK